jgi:dienelactone hydrolase
MSRRKDVEFEAGDGIKLRAWLFEPTAGRCPCPAMTMAHGYAGVREHGVEPFARAFADAGIAVLLHDHRNLGAREGQPRQDIDPWQQISDWRRAISYLESLPEIDPLGSVCGVQAMRAATPSYSAPPNEAYVDPPR